MAKEANHNKCLKATAAAEKKAQKAENALLKFAGVIQNRYQDISDVIENDDLDDIQKINKIEKLANKIGDAVAKVLPE